MSEWGLVLDLLTALARTKGRGTPEGDLARHLLFVILERAPQARDRKTVVALMAEDMAALDWQEARSLPMTTVMEPWRGWRNPAPSTNPN